MTRNLNSVIHDVRAGKYLTARKLETTIDRLIPDLLESGDQIRAGCCETDGPVSLQTACTVSAG
jgi:hypothetical protein